MMTLKSQAKQCGLIVLCIFLWISLTVREVEARRYFLMERPMLGLDLSYEMEKSDRSGTNINRADTTHTFLERVDIETSGWVYHPALAEYKIKFSPEWEQDSTRSEGGEKRTTRSFFTGYFEELTLLKYKPYTLSIFSNRSRSTLSSSFSQRSKSETDVYGATLSLKYRILPTIFSYNHEKSSQKGFYTTDRESDEFRVSTKYDQHLGATLLDASYKDTTQATQGIFRNQEIKNATLQNSSNLTKDRRVLLLSGLGFSSVDADATGRTDYTRFSENLPWRHRENLSTDYSFRYDKNASDVFSSETKSLSFHLQHLLYETLLTSIDTEASSSKFTGGNTGQYNSGVSFNYNREVPKGRLNINIGYNYWIVNQDFVPGYIQIFNESVFLDDSALRLLAHEGVDTNSIIVSDNTGTITYIKDIDYRIIEIGYQIRISRIITGSILNGQEVLVNYRYISSSPFDSATFNQSYGVSLNLWSAWRLYYKYSNSRQKVLSGTPTQRLADDAIHTAGTELDWKWNRTTFEFEDRETTTTPSQKWSIKETVTPRPFQKASLKISGHYGETKFKETGNLESVFGIVEEVQFITTPWSRLRFEGSLEKISGRLRNTIDSGFMTVFEWKYRIWSGGIRYKFLHQEDREVQQTNKNHYFICEIKRILF
jgi:hypothetical protein